MKKRCEKELKDSTAANQELLDEPEELEEWDNSFPPLSPTPFDWFFQVKHNPEKKLLFRVLRRALIDAGFKADLVANRHHPNVAHFRKSVLKEESLDAIEWLLDEGDCFDDKGISFNYVCEVLKISSDLKKRIRTILKEMGYEMVSTNSNSTIAA